MIPQQIPYREVIHQESDGESDWTGSQALSVGEAKQTALWLKDKVEEAAFDKQLRLKDNARARLGGFGFCAARVH